MDDLDIADEINNLFANVATDLQPLQSISAFNLNDDHTAGYVITPEEVEMRLACINEKSPWSGRNPELDFWGHGSVHLRTAVRYL